MELGAFLGHSGNRTLRVEVTIALEVIPLDFYDLIRLKMEG